DFITKNLDELAKLESLCTGKTMFDSGKVEIPFAADVFRYFAGWATKIHGETLAIRPGAFTFTLRQPVGVVGAIVPWNFPFLLSSWKLAPALAAGNTIVLKPASQTPLTALKFAELCQEAGVPEGVVNVVTGPGGKVGMAMVRDPRVDKIAFTGSTEVGKQIMREAAGTLKRLSLELGGKSPNIVFGDADVAAAVTGGGRATVGNGKGYFIQPTIFDGVRNSMKIAREEIFGPVLSVIPFKSLEEGLAEGNNTTYGLAAAVWTRDVAKALRAAQTIRA